MAANASQADRVRAAARAGSSGRLRIAARPLLLFDRPMRRIVIIDGHPHADPDHFVHALARSYMQGARRDHEIRVIELSKLQFPILRDPEDWKESQVPAGLAETQQDICWADHLVILYPLWLGDMPALLKGFLEQALRRTSGVRHEPMALERLQA